MTIGIYSITFTKCNKSYVGQSNNVERRWKEHANNFKAGKVNVKLLEAYNKYGTPIFTLIEECSLNELDDKERALIKELDLINTGLNITEGGDSAGSGTTHNQSKYSKELIIEIFQLLISDELYLQKHIAEGLGVPPHLVHCIAKGENHSGWLREKFPETYPKLQEQNKLRMAKWYANKVVHNPMPHRTLPTLLGPDGTEYNIVNISEFCRIHDLAHSSLSRVLSAHAKYKSHKG